MFGEFLKKCEKIIDPRLVGSLRLIIENFNPPPPVLQEFQLFTRHLYEQILFTILLKCESQINITNKRFPKWPIKLLNLYFQKQSVCLWLALVLLEQYYEHHLCHCVVVPQKQALVHLTFETMI